MKIWLAIAASLLAGCQSLPPPVEKVTVTVEKIVPVPEDLSRDCDVPVKKANTYGELKRLRGADLAALEECNGRMAKIRSLGQTD